MTDHEPTPAELSTHYLRSYVSYALAQLRDVDARRVLDTEDRVSRALQALDDAMRHLNPEGEP